MVMNNIFIIGFMGTGKTSVSKQLSKKIKKKYVCLDGLIEEITRNSINNIFSEQGEKEFRKIEKKVFLWAVEKDNQVIDTGGGIILDPDNIKIMKQKGIIICLKANVDTICNRIKDCVTRPLLQVDNPKETIKKLLKPRLSLYAKADFFVDTDDLTVEQIVEKIEEIINNVK